MSFLYWLEDLRNPIFDFIFSVITLFGEETIFMAVGMIIFWCLNKYDGYYLEYYSILFHFLHLLVTDYKQDISHLSLPNTDKYIERLSLITEYVQDHYREPISLQDASELLSLNPEYFSRFFKKYMGVTFLEYVYSVRLQAAYQELINTDLPIQQVQEHNG